MANNQTRLPMPRPLAETSLNPVRPNPAAAQVEANGKRKLTQSSNIQPVNKVPRSGTNPRSLQNLASHGSASSGIGRPASAASSRHGQSRSVDVGSYMKASGLRPPSAMQAARMRPGTATETRQGKASPPSDITMSSMSQISSCTQSVTVSSNQARPRKASQRSSMSSLCNGFANLHVSPRPGSHDYKKVGNLRPSLRKVDEHKNASIDKSRIPKRRFKKEPVTPGGYLTIESNTRVPPAFDIHTSLSHMETVMQKFQRDVGQTVEERESYGKILEQTRSQITEMETSRAQMEKSHAALRRELEDNNAMLRRELDSSREMMNVKLREADDARRRQLEEIDELRRRHRDELDESRRGHRNEIDDLRREQQRSQDGLLSSAKQDAEQLEKRHQAELECLRKEMTLNLEEEQRARKRDVEELEGRARDAQRDADSGLERHQRVLQDRESHLQQLSHSLEQERETITTLRRQINRSEEQIAELENTTRSLKAQVEFLKSDSKSQSQAFTDLEQQTQDALRETEEYKSQLRREETIRRKLLNQIQDLKGNIRVFCRVRPPLATEMGACAQIDYPDTDSECRAIEVLGQEEKSSLGKVTTRSHAFSFDRSFGPTSHNAEIFTELSELVAAVCGGSFNTCIFSYGQTGSGKTYTMASPDGMIARAVNQIFDTAGDLVEKGWRYTITGSFVEVYNENINDLLGRPEDFDKKKHEIRHNMQTLTTEITDVTDVELESSRHFETVLEQALRNRSIAATKANERSSRSHSVCILKLTGENRLTGETCRSTLNLVDLAGSERLAHSQATGNRLKETQNINKSLSCLADVIAALGEAREGSHIPYRNSKLTYLLQNSLGGNSKTLMFVMISPLQEHLSETLSSLNFATKVNNTRIVRKQKR